MNKIFLKSVSKALIAAVLILVMWIFQYYPEIADFKFWLGLVVVAGILIYILSLVGGLAKRLAECSKEKEQCQKECAETSVENAQKEEENY